MKKIFIMFFVVLLGSFFTSFKVNAVTKTPFELLRNMTSYTDSSSSIMDDILISKESKCSIITIKFNYFVKYIRHFPYTSGTELRIKLALIGVKPQDKNSSLARESLLPPPEKANSNLSSVHYEGDLQGGPFLTLFFLKEMKFKIKENRNSKTINIIVTGTSPNETANDCFKSAT